MTKPLGTGKEVSASGDVDFGLQLSPPSFELIEPTTAPAYLLENVRVNTEGRCLEATTPIGTVSLEMRWKTDENPDSDESRGHFFSALDSELDPDAATNPLATQRLPFTILPNGALYEVAVRTPLDAVEVDWSEERSRDIGGLLSFAGISLAEFREAYPGVEVNLPEGRYKITATERTRPTLAVAARVEDGEPLMRVATVTDTSVTYKETLAGGFRQSILRPDTAVAVINSRTTIRGNGEDADSQRLEFTLHDGMQRTGLDAEENSGVIEVILLQATEVECLGFTFSEVKPFIAPSSSFDDFGGLAMRGGGMTFGGDDLGMTRGSGLQAGETRFRKPETIKVSMGGVRDLRPVAAFRFALAGADETQVA